MADVHEPEIRSYNMSRIKGKDTKPEMLVRKFLHAHGFRYKLHDKKLPGKPDIVLPKYNSIVLVHGCFWHGHEGCKYYVVPKTRTQWWLDKIAVNKRKDQENEKKLNASGWNVFIVFECELKSGNQQETLMNLIKKITNGNSGN
ncbi:very short patch repair endonuclease [Cyclobacterium sp. SYSU L10401]|uniref:very short patch repair endonuclease n=1 Tax=Cyclobacterium sp. SYSU L10401 TaxID=2678657 RepID=UPI0013D4B1AC|nr:DNA mismatch endonuclease Vsr [Cyclobacterium sp. SYSU L10401]